MVMVPVFRDRETLGRYFAKNLSHLDYTYADCYVTPTPTPTKTNYTVNLYSQRFPQQPNSVNVAVLLK